MSQDREKKLEELLQKAQSRASKFEKALCGVIEALACDASDRKIGAIIRKALCENTEKGGESQ